jgi:hypothetical protein
MEAAGGMASTRFDLARADLMVALAGLGSKLPATDPLTSAPTAEDYNEHREAATGAIDTAITSAIQEREM